VDKAPFKAAGCAEGLRVGLGSVRVRRALGASLLGAIAAGAWAEPVIEPWASESPGVATAAVGAASLSGWYASAQTEGDMVEIRDIRQSLMGTIARGQIEALAPWMSLGTGPDGPVALAWTDSGRSLFVVVTDDSTAPDGLGSDVVLRFDTTTGQLSLFARAEIGDGTEPGLAAVHFRGELTVSTQAGPLRVYRAGRNDTAGVLLYAWSLPGGEAARGLAVARSLDALFVTSQTMLYRVDLGEAFPVPVEVGPVTRGRGVAFSDHYGSLADAGAYVVEGSGGGADARVLQVPLFQAAGLLTYNPIEYVQSSDDLADITATACGRMMLAGAGGTQIMRDTGDPRLDYEAWLLDEFAQVVAFGNGLVSPDGEPPGWVIDADVDAGLTRFHPATPDAAAWVVLLNITRDHLAGNTASAMVVRDILGRYAGQMPDGIAPSVTADGIVRHWIDPWTGGAKPGWDAEFATLSTMKLVLAADRARRFYAGDSAIVDAADAIIDRVNNWDAYIQPGSDALYFKGVFSGGPDFGSAAGPFHEGVIFVEQAAAYGTSEAALDHWLDRSLLPEAEYVTGLPVTTNWPGAHIAAFVSLYPLLAQKPLRADQTWRADLSNLLASNGAWTDDHGPTYMTVFSAGTTRSDWGGYSADSLSNHPGDVTTFPSLMAFGSLGLTAPSVGAYQAYRHGVRQTFEGGASILYRRSQVDPGYEPNSAGMPDVALGALGLAELIKPGTAAAVLAVDYQSPCPADLAVPAGVLDFFDIAAFLDAFSTGDDRGDLAAPFGTFDFFDVIEYLDRFSAGCP
jgi:hypothetical protein